MEWVSAVYNLWSIYKSTMIWERQLYNILTFIVVEYAEILSFSFCPYLNTIDMASPFPFSWFTLENKIYIDQELVNLKMYSKAAPELEQGSYLNPFCYLEVYCYGLSLSFFHHWLVTYFNFKKLFMQIGKTKVFLRAGQMADLDARRSEVLGRSASIIQRKIRSFLARRSFFSLRRSAIHIQALCRGIYCLYLCFAC